MIKSNVREIMAIRGMSVRQLVKKSGTAMQTVTNVRSNAIKGCQLSTLERIAEALEVSPHELFTYIPNIPSTDQEESDVGLGSGRSGRG